MEKRFIINADAKDVNRLLSLYPNFDIRVNEDDGAVYTYSEREARTINDAIDGRIPAEDDGAVSESTQRQKIDTGSIKIIVWITSFLQMVLGIFLVLSIFRCVGGNYTIETLVVNFVYIAFLEIVLTFLKARLKEIYNKNI